MKAPECYRRHSALLASLLAALGVSANAQLLHRYNFTSDATDSVGTAHGTLEGTATISGGALVTDGSNGSLNAGVPRNGVMLPASAVADITSAFTIECWFIANLNGGFCTAFSFSDSTTANYVLATPARGNSPYASSISVIGGGGNTAEQQASEQYQDDAVLHDMLVTYDGATLSYYIDGALGSFAGLPPTITDSGLNLSTLTDIGIAGGSPWPDNSIKGSTRDFRIYGQALTPAQVATVYGLGSDASNAALSNAVAPATAFVWNGGGANNNWSTGLNWVGGAAPATSGTSLTFAGSTRPTPNLDANYNVTGLVFSNNASSFTIGTANGSTLTLAGDVVNNSANAQMLNVPLVSVGANFNAAAGSLVVNSNLTLTAGASVSGANSMTLNGTVSGSGNFIKTGTGTLTLAGSPVSASTVSFNDGTTLLSGAVNSAGGKTYIGYLTGNAVVTMSGGTLNTGDEVRVGGSDQSGSTVVGSGAFTMNGGTANLGSLTLARGNSLDNNVLGTVTLNSGSTLISTNDVIVQFAGSGTGKLVLNGGAMIIGPTGLRWLMVGYFDSGAGELDITNGNLFLENGASIKMCRGGNTGANVINQEGGAVTFYNDGGVTVGGGGNLDLSYAGGGSSSSTYNLDGGTLTVPQITASSSSGSSTFNFNGGTIKPTASSTTFMQGLSIAYVKPGGAIIDTAGQNIAIAQPLADGGGGLTKKGAGTLTLSGGYFYSGTTLVQAGTLALDAAQSSSGSALTVNNATLSLSLNNGSSSISAGAVSFVGGSVLNLNYGTATSPTAAAITASGVSQSGTTVINILGNNLVVGTYPVIYTGSAVPTTGFSLGSLPTGVTAHLNNSGTSLDLVITAAGQNLTWYGADSSGNPLTTWNINTSVNWNSGAAKYLQYSGNSYGDNVTFDDMVFTAADANITLNSAVVPASVRFNNSTTPYSVTGSGTIGGATSVLVANNGSVFLGTSNNYAGGTTISGGGSVIVDNDHALGASTAPVTLNGGTLQFSNSTTSVRPVSVAAASVIDVAAGANAQLGGLISGNADLTKNGMGTLTVSNLLSGGHLNFNNGTTVVAGTVASGNSELWVSGGVAGNQGTLTVPAGATVLCTNNWLVIGRDGSSGTLNVGGGTVIHNGNGSITCGTLGGANVAVGTINLTSGSISNLNGETYIPEGTSDLDYGYYNQSGGIASLGNLYIGRAASWAGSGIGQATVTGGTLNVANLDIAYSDNNTKYGTNSLTIGSGATVNASGFVRLAFAGSTSRWGMLTNHGGTLNVGSTALYLSYWPDGCSGHVVQSAGALNLENNASIIFALNGAQISTNDFTQSGGTVTFYSDAGTTVGGTGSLNLGNSGSAHNTYTLAAGTLTVPQVRQVSGTGTFVFSGGTLKAAGSSSTFMNGLTAANVMAGGAVIDSAGNNITIGQALVDGDGLGGGLTKNGSGTVLLSGANTYTGPTRVNAGTLELAQPTLAASSTVTVAGGAVLQLDFAATNLVAGLVLNGVNQGYGLYDSATASPYITGAGSLLVTASNPTNITVTVSGSSLHLSWPPDHRGWILQTATNLPAPVWVDVPGTGSVSTTNISINPAIPAEFFRLRHP